MMPLAALIKEEARSEKLERPLLRYGCASQSKKGEDFFLMKTDCVRVSGNPSSTFAVFSVSIPNFVYLHLTFSEGSILLSGFVAFKQFS
jgi:hypothetical protein